MCAAAAGQTNAAEWLLQHEASVNLHAQGGVTALMFAVLGQDIATLKLLCAARASLDAVELEHQDHVRVEGRRTAPRGHTPLEIAEANGNKTAVAILREHGEHLRHESDAAAAALLEEEELLQSSSSSPLGRSAGKSGKRERERKRAALRRERQQHQHQPPHDPQESQEQQESTSVSEQQFARLLLATDRETSSSSSGQARSVDEEAASTSSSSSHSQAHSETPPSSETPSALNSALNSAAAAAAAAAAARRQSSKSCSGRNARAHRRETRWSGGRRLRIGTWLSSTRASSSFRWRAPPLPPRWPLTAQAPRWCRSTPPRTRPPRTRR